MRVEDQHLLKLPISGAVVFGIRIASLPLAAAMENPEVRAGLKTKLRTMPPDIACYKDVARWRAAQDGEPGEIRS